MLTFANWPAVRVDEGLHYDTLLVFETFVRMRAHEARGSAPTAPRIQRLRLGQPRVPLLGWMSANARKGEHALDHRNLEVIPAHLPCDDRDLPRPAPRQRSFMFNGFHALACELERSTEPAFTVQSVDLGAPPMDEVPSNPHRVIEHRITVQRSQYP